MKLMNTMVEKFFPQGKEQKTGTRGEGTMPIKHESSVILNTCLSTAEICVILIVIILVLVNIFCFSKPHF